MRFAAFAPTLALACAAASSGPGHSVAKTGTSCAGLPSTDSAVYDTTQLNEHPRVRNGPRIEYPDWERQRGIQGRVIIGLVIEPDGAVNQDSVRVLQSVDPDIDREALRWVRRASFWPGCRNGLPVRVRDQIPIDFKIIR